MSVNPTPAAALVSRLRHWPKVGPLSPEFDEAADAIEALADRLAVLEALAAQQAALIVEMLPHVALVASAAGDSYLDRHSDDETVWDSVNPRVSQVRSALALLPRIAPYDVDPLEGEGLDVNCRYCWAYGFNGRGSDPDARAHGEGCTWEASQAMSGAAAGEQDPQ